MEGYEEGCTCGRDGCTGVIKTHPPENFSCHLSAPCGSCTDPRNFCPECDWEESEDPAPETAPPTASDRAGWAASAALWKRRTLADLDGSKIDWIHVPCDSTCSMIKEGVYPFGTAHADLLAAINGTFGGRFESHTPATEKQHGSFKFIAYTD